MDELGSGEVLVFEGFGLDRCAGGLYDWIRLATQHQWRSKRVLDLLALIVRRKGNSSERTRSCGRLGEQGGSGNLENASSDNLHAPSISSRRHLGDRLTGCGGAEPTSITLVSQGRIEPSA